MLTQSVLLAFENARKLSSPSAWPVDAYHYWSSLSSLVTLAILNSDFRQILLHKTVIALCSALFTS